MKGKFVPVSRKPVQIKRGNDIVKIYTDTNRVADRAYPQFTLVYYDAPRFGGVARSH